MFSRIGITNFSVAIDELSQTLIQRSTDVAKKYCNFSFSLWKKIVPIIFTLFSCSSSFGADTSVQSIKSAKYKVLCKISRVVSSQRLILVCQERLVDGEKLALITKDIEGGIFGFVNIEEQVNSKNYEASTSPQGGAFVFEASLSSLVKMQMVQVGDQVARIDLTSEDENYKSDTSLFIKKSSQAISSKYKLLVTQGPFIGETAESLWQDEFLVNYLGQINYGIYSWMTIGTLAPANAVGAPNGQFKFRLYNSNETILSMGLNFTKIPNSDESTANITFMWDSVSNRSLISHNYITLAVVSFKNAQDAAALKSVGTSSLQTGYEFLLSNWNRVLIGPNYNFENRKVGGYVSFIKIWDRFHLQLSLNTTNIESFKISATDGYYPFIDMYWRY